MKIFVTLCFALVNLSVIAQVNEALLTDTVGFISNKVSELESWRIEQEAVRLNFDDCNLQLMIDEKTGENPAWSTQDFWLPDLDETKMQLVYVEKHEEWALKLVCSNGLRKIRGTSNYSAWKTDEVFIYSTTKEPLIELGKALFYATKSCKGLDRFKD